MTTTFSVSGAQMTIKQYPKKYVACRCEKPYIGIKNKSPIYMQYYYWESLELLQQIILNTTKQYMAASCRLKFLKIPCADDDH